MSSGPETAVSALPVVNTEAGPITVATVGELMALFTRDVAELGRLRELVATLEQQSEQELTDLGIDLAGQPPSAPSSPDVAERLAEALALREMSRSLDRRLKEIDERPLAGRIGGWRAHHRMETERDQAARRLRALGLQLGGMASDADLAVLADPAGARERRAQQHLRLSAARSELTALSSRANVLRDEVAQRKSIIGKSGFDPYYATARLIVDGPPSLLSPLELRRSEVVYHTANVTLARMQRQTRYTGVSQGSAFRWAMASDTGSVDSKDSLCRRRS
jgi:hypothetical protein